MSHIQSQIHNRILIKHEKLKNVFGFYKNSNHIQNVIYHQKSVEILNIDIKDFFGSINEKQVYFVFSKLFQFNSQISTALTKLTTVNNSLPQGAPTSPMLSNLVFRNVDYRLNKLVSTLGVKYSRYADDLTFSSSQSFDKVYLYSKVKEILGSNNYYINSGKTSFQSTNLNVNGINIIDGKLSIRSHYKRNIYQELYYIENFGLLDHLRHKFLNFEKNPDIYIQELLGRINYVYQVEPTAGLEMFNLLKQTLHLSNNS